MSTTGVAPRVVLDAPLPRPPLHGLTGSPAAATLAPEQTHWQAGANLVTYPEARPDANDPCADGTFRDKLTPDPFLLPDSFPGFTAYLGEVCTAAGIGDWGRWQARANAALLARTSWTLERQLAWGMFAGGPFLADADVDVLAMGTALAARVAIAFLEGYLAMRGQAGVIHLTPEVATYVGFETILSDGQQLRTVAGTPVVVGQGYSDQSGDDNLLPAGGIVPYTEASDGQSWIFASSPVLYRMSDVIALPETIGEALDRETNDVVYRAERDLWVAFDGGPHAAVLADWSPT